MTLSALGDSAVVIALGEGIDEQVLARVRALTAALEQDRLPGVVDVVPAYATVTVFYDPAEVAARLTPDFMLIEQGPRGTRFFADAPKVPLASFMAVPLRVQNRLIGFIAVASFTPRKRFDEGQRKLLSMIGSRAAQSCDGWAAVWTTTLMSLP